MTRAELLARVSSLELSEWRAYSQVEPFGEERADMRAALVAQTMANLWRGKNTNPFTLEDFMLKFEPEPEPMTPDQMMRAFALATGAQR